MATQNINDLIAAALAKRSDDDIRDMDKGGGFAKIDESGIHECKVVMAKNMVSKNPESQAAKFVVELENKDGAKLFWDSGYYLNKAGSPVTEDGNLSIGASKLIALNYLLTGKDELPQLSEATIKETQWDNGTPSEVSVKRDIAKALIGQFILVQSVRIKTNIGWYLNVLSTTVRDKILEST